MGRDASVYPRKGSPYWYCSYFDVASMERRHAALPWRLDDPTGERKAQQFANEKSEQAANFRGHTKREIWNGWVPRWIREKYKGNPLTHTRVVNAWSWLSVWLVQRKLPVPRAVTTEEVAGYIGWRLEQKRHCGKGYSRNTAIMELKFFKQMMVEAKWRGYSTDNPCEGMRLKRDPAKVKPELSDEEIALIRAECARLENSLPIAEQWMTTSFEIALHTWCRISSTQVPMNLVDLKAGEITVRAKGGRMDTIPIHDDLRPRLEALRKSKAQWTCVLPRSKNGTLIASLLWWRLRQKMDIGHTAFHSTRVTGITRARRAGVPESIAMRIAGHRNPTVHRIYQREAAGELAAHLQKVSYRPAALPAPASTAPGDEPR